MAKKQKIVGAADVLERLTPGMRIFVGTGGAEPKTLVRQLIESESPNLEDLELIQLVSFGNAISAESLDPRKYRLKTFFAGGIAASAITAGHVDLVPCRFSAIPRLFARRLFHVDVTFVQVTPPDPMGYCSLGTSIDVAHQAMEQSTLVVGEICHDMPSTMGDTFVHVDQFDLLVEGTEPFTYIGRWPVPAVWDKVAANVASVIRNGSCVGFALGPLYEALGRHLKDKQDLSVHSPFFTDPLMDLVESGAVTNRHKKTFRGKSLVSYALGTKELMQWLDKNPLVEFQSIEKVFSPLVIGKNSRAVFVIPARKVDLSGHVALRMGGGNTAAGPSEAVDFVNGTELSPQGQSVFALPSRNRNGEPNIRMDIEDFPNQFSMREAVDIVATEYGVATLRGRTVRERAQALIEIAHPEDRAELVAQAKGANILYHDQIFLPQSVHLYPADITATETFGDETVRFRAMKPSDEDEMRRLFYRFSNETVYYRYFTRIKSMPHAKMQEYVNVDYSRALSIVGLVGEPGEGHIVAEARFVKLRDRPMADLAFVVDEKYQGRGMASFLLQLLVRLAQERGLQGFTADVLASNRSMMRVFERSGHSMQACLSEGAYELTVFFNRTTSRATATVGDDGLRRNGP
jgi:acyl-CoA hydrolase